MKRIVFSVLTCGLLAGLALMGCSDSTKARVEVAKDAALKKIDSFLGNLDVQHKEIELALKTLKEATTEVGKQKIKAQVKVDQIDAKVQPIRDQMAKADSSLKRFRELIAANAPAELGGKTYSVEEITKMAAKVVEAHKGYETQIAANEQSQVGLKKIVVTLEKRQLDLKGKITRLEANMAEIDTQIAAAKAMKDASSSIGDSGATLDENIAKLEDKMAGLMADAKVELTVENEKWDAVSIDKDIDSVDSIINKSQQSTDTLAEIDRILGNSP